VRLERLLEGGAMIRHEEAGDRVRVAARGAQAGDVPDVLDRDVRSREEERHGLARAVGVEQRRALGIDYRGVVGAGVDGVVDAAGGDPAPGDAIASRDSGGCRRAVAPGEDHVREAEDLALTLGRQVTGHATDAAVLRHRPGDAAVRPGELFDDLGELMQVELGATDRARDEHAIEAGALDRGDQ